MTSISKAIPALLVIVSLWEAYAAHRDAHAVPGDDAWQAAAEVVRAERRAGDLIVFAPEWIDPVGRLHLGDLISIDDAGRMDAAKYARIWELSIRGAHAPEVRDLAPVFERDVDGVTVRRFERAPEVVVADVRDRPGGSVVLAEVGFAPHRCVQAVPQPGHPIRISYPQLPLGTKLVGYAGLADVFTRRDIRAPGFLSIEIDGREAASVTLGVDDGWVRFEIPTPPGPADVTFVAAADAPQRLICFAAETRQ